MGLGGDGKKEGGEEERKKKGKKQKGKGKKEKKRNKKTTLNLQLTTLIQYTIYKYINWTSVRALCFFILTFFSHTGLVTSNLFFYFFLMIC